VFGFRTAVGAGDRVLGAGVDPPCLPRGQEQSGLVHLPDELPDVSHGLFVRAAIALRQSTVCAVRPATA
jgi:hypothetical protein